MPFRPRKKSWRQALFQVFLLSNFVSFENLFVLYVLGVCTQMADRELRRMHRAELIEIIYALKQSEDQLKAQNAALTAQLQDRQLRLESAGSIAQAALDTLQNYEQTFSDFQGEAADCRQFGPNI